MQKIDLSIRKSTEEISEMGMATLRDYHEAFKHSIANMERQVFDASRVEAPCEGYGSAAWVIRLRSAVRAHRAQKQKVGAALRRKKAEQKEDAKRQDETFNRDYVNVFKSVAKELMPKELYTMIAREALKRCEAEAEKVLEEVVVDDSWDDWENIEVL